jgi:hypothetical protein
MALLRSEPQIVGREVTAALKTFLASTDALRARPWWEALSGMRTTVFVPPDIDAIMADALKRASTTADAILQLGQAVIDVNPTVTAGLGMVERVLRSWTLRRARHDDPVPDGFMLTSLLLPVKARREDETDDDEGVAVLEHVETVKLMTTAARDSLTIPVATWTQHALNVARGEGAHRHLVEAIFWMVEGSIRCQRMDEDSRLAALKVHTGVAMAEYYRFLDTLQAAVDERLPAETKTREEIIEELLAVTPKEQHGAIHKFWKKHQCHDGCPHTRMDPRRALRESQEYRASVRAAYLEAEEATYRLRDSLDGYAGQLGLHAIFPAAEAGAVKVMLDNIAGGLRKAATQGFRSPRRMQAQDRRDMRRRGHDPESMMRRVALTVAGILAGIDLQNLARDVGTLVGGAPITERARMAHWSMEHPTLALGVVDFHNLGVPAQDIDGMMRVLRGFVDRAEVPNEREELIAAMERFRTEVGVRQTERTDADGRSTIRWRVSRRPDEGWWAISPNAVEAARARVARGVAGVDYDLEDDDEVEDDCHDHDHD